jgi:hypothetical protein
MEQNLEAPRRVSQGIRRSCWYAPCRVELRVSDEPNSASRGLCLHRLKLPMFDNDNQACTATGSWVQALRKQGDKIWEGSQIHEIALWLTYTLQDIVND